jgi:hypothetical protein
MEITNKKSRSHLLGNYMARRENRKINIEASDMSKLDSRTTSGDLLTIYNSKSNKQR